MMTVFKGAFETEPNYLYFCYFDLCGPCRCGFLLSAPNDFD